MAALPSTIKVDVGCEHVVMLMAPETILSNSSTAASEVIGYLGWHFLSVELTLLNGHTVLVVKLT